MDQNLEEEKKIDSGFIEIVHFSEFFAKFACGSSLFINKILCFTILVDSFNMNIVETIVLVDPYYLLCVAFGCMLL
jgi:hypothetical protein